MVVDDVIASLLLLSLLFLLYSVASDTDTFDKSKSSKMAIKHIACHPQDVTSAEQTDQVEQNLVMGGVFG